MLKNDKRLMAAAAAVVAGAMAFAAPALAHPHPDGDGDGKGKVQRFIILTDGKGESGERKEVRRFLFEGGPHALVTCDGEKTEVKEETNGDRTRIVLCNKGEASAADRAKRLEEALERITKEDGVSAEHKAKVTAALRAEIERLRNAK
jgi:hypothetical protein